MKLLAMLAVLAGAHLASGKVLSSWQPEQTAVVAIGQPPVLPPPMPTPLAALPELFRRLDDQHTCGYLNGSTEYPLTCSSGYVCSTSAGHGVWHCCASTANSCFMPTACLDYTAFANGLCSNVGASTTCCSLSATGLCTSIPFADKPSISLVGCLPSSFIVPVYASPLLSTTTPPPTSSPASPSTTPSPPPSSTTTTTDTGGGGGSSNSNIGAIVGGVVGGVAVIAIIAGAVAWIMIRNKRHQAAQPSYPAAAVGSPPPPSGYPSSGQSPPPPMAQHGYAPTHDPRTSMLSNPHDSVYGHSMGGSSMMGSPVQPASPAFVTPYIPPHQQQSVGPGLDSGYSRNLGAAAELPSSKMSDPTSYELAGH